MAVQKSYGLYRLFIKFILTLLVGVILSIVIPLLLFLIGEKFGYVNEANAGEKTARAVIMKTQKMQSFDPTWVSSQNKYVQLNQNYELMGSSMDKSLQQAAIQAVKIGKIDSGSFLQTRLGTGYLVIDYKLKPSYTNDFLNKYFLSPDTLILVGIIIILVITVVMSVKRFSHMIRLNLSPITRAVKHIQDNDLNFTVGTSTITEFDDVLVSFTELKESLRGALEERWQSEENHRSQLTALVHDVKTPLTGVIGWGELLSETELTVEQSVYLKNLQASTEAIEQLVNTLMQVTREAKEIELSISQVNLVELIDDIKQNLMPVIKVKKISFDTTFELDDGQISLDPFLLTQALTSIISNAIDFVSLNGTIKLVIHRDKQELNLIIEDDGPGFSSELLEKAFTTSYMGDSSRSGMNHFGMGLTIAKRNVERCGGEITLGKSSALGGASVMITIPQ